jgi:hypothetical protein
MRRGQHARALLRSLWLSIATDPETYATALQPTFRMGLLILRNI